MKKLYLLLPFLLGSVMALAQQNQSVLTFDEIMSGEDYIGKSPSKPFWAKDSKTIYFYWNKENNAFESLYKVDIKTKKYSKVSPEEEKQLPSARGNWNNDQTKKVYIKDNNVFVYNFKKGLQQQITNTTDRKSGVKFLDDNTKIAYKQGDNIFIWDEKTGVTHQLTNFVRGSAPRSVKASPQQEFLNEQQKELFEIVRLREERKEAKQEHKELVSNKGKEKVYLNGQYVSNVVVSNDANYAVYSLGKSAGSYATEMPVWVEGTGYVKMQNARPKVGSPEDTFKSFVYDIQKDTVYSIDLSKLSGIKDTPKYFENYPERDSSLLNQMRQVVMHPPQFSPNKNYAVADVRAYDNKDRWLIQINLQDGSFTEIDRQHDDAWVGGPGISGWNFWVGPIGWLNDNTLWYQSEKTGFSHLYTYNAETKETKAITAGDFEIHKTEVSKDKKFFYLTSNKENSSEVHFYKVSIDGGEMTKLTSAVGHHSATLSPDEKYFADIYSYSNKPEELYIQANKSGSDWVKVTKSTTEAFDKYEWRVPEVVTFKAKDGQSVHARLYKPEASKDQHKAVLFVHGAGYLQNVHNWWSVYYREYMFHNMLVDNGYTVLDIDYRASSGYGRDWRTGIYRHMGGLDLSDHVDGAQFLIKEHGIDKDRIGIYGGSYGGFITLMAMFNESETFKAGAAIRSVTDWAHYNHPYTSNILNTPALDPEAFKKSSPIYFAEGLKGNLLILHGMVDDNVQFQDVVRLSQRLIELKKENWDMAIYPIEPHGFKETTSWIDEYKRIFNLFQEKL
ncbi:S9 family peptidase [Flammeovirga aprica]|uniref:Prolyl oligopeptidase family serine peptidase n=1 Tax=Flammeovirga aprica JL-4 TaxID=694437 RepID=A0A7X9RY90_9BACT|nr:prolyl oligopeptidase family serine peptidase [Flammeovirga aprica]NME70967.1 prolyl oligopeptidase family serine peptidase [Flammeovirga aprica JL-4]